MGRPRAAEPKAEQLNVRVTKDTLDLLEVVAWLDESSPADFVRQAVEAALDARRSADSEVDEELDRRHARRRRRDHDRRAEDGNVTQLPLPGPAS